MIDLQMPDIDGFDAISELKQRGIQSAYWIAVTGDGTDESSKSLIQAGYHRVVCKPISKSILISAISDKPQTERIKYSAVS